MASHFDHVAGVWSAPVQIGGAVTWLSDLVRVRDGALIAWGDCDTRRILSRRFDKTSGSWQSELVVATPAPGTQDDYVWLAENQGGDVAASWLVFDDSLREAPRAVRAAMLPAGTSVWGPPRDFAVNTGWFGSLARCSMSDQGLALVAWSELNPAGNTVRIRCSRGLVGGGFQDAEDLGQQATLGKPTRPYPNQPRPLASQPAVFWATDGEQWSATYSGGQWGTPSSLGREFDIVIGDATVSPNGTVHVVGVRSVGLAYAFSPGRLTSSGQLLRTSPINLSPDTSVLRQLSVRALANETALAVWEEESTGAASRVSVGEFEPGDRQLGRAGSWRLPSPLPEGTYWPYMSGNARAQVLIGYVDRGQIRTRLYR